MRPRSTRATGWALVVIVSVVTVLTLAAVAGTRS